MDRRSLLRLMLTGLLLASAAASTAGGATPFASALDAALADPGGRSGVRIFVECFDEGDFRSVDVLGRGIGIWDGRRQFEIPPAGVDAVLEAVHRAGFAELEEVYGGTTKGDAEKPAEPPGAAAALRLVCAVTVTLGDASKRVVQLDHGEQSAELAALAAEVFRRLRPHAAAGVEATDLGDGLRKVAAGALAPETLRLVLHRQPRAAGGGFLLRLDGRVVTSRDFAPGRGYGPDRRLELAADAFAELAADLAALASSELPRNLFASDYTDLSLRVLDQKAEVLARPFAGRDPTAAGQPQRDFDLVTDLLYNLHLRVAADGSVVEGQVDEPGRH